MNGANNRIEGFNFSIVGRSHIKSETVCQDFSMIHLGNRFSFAAVADGVGSCKYSEIGAKVAVETLFKHCEPLLENSTDDKLCSALRKGFDLCNEEIAKIAKESGNDITDYDTTLTAAVFDGSKVIFGHIGDGGLLGMKKNGEYELLTTVTKGDTWNEVIPLRTDSKYYHFEIVKEEYCAIALFTDGLFDVACPAILKNADNKIYHAFISHFIKSDHILQDLACVDKEEDAKKYIDLKHQDLQDDLSAAVLMNKDANVTSPDSSYYDEPNWEKIKTEIYYKLYPHLIPKDEAKDDSN